VYQETGRLEEAEQSISQALALYTQAGHQANMASALAGLGRVRWARQDPAGACGQLEAALRLYETMGEEVGIAYACHALGQGYLALEQVDRAGGCTNRRCDCTGS
jgi:tetratricopeptide (TPR) repeat protein